MFEEYSCGCIWSRFQGRVRVCGGHRNLIEYYVDANGQTKWSIKRFDPTGKVVKTYAGNGETP